MPEPWVLFSLMAALIWAAGNIVDKYVLTKWIRDPAVSLVLFGAVGAIAGVFVYFARGLGDLSGVYALLAIAAGIMHTASIGLYFKAVQIEEISRVVPLFYTTPLFVLFLAAVFLGEIFTLQKYLGIFLLVLGAILISAKDIKKLHFGRALEIMLLASLISAAVDIAEKYLLGFSDFWTVFAYTRIGGVLALVPLVRPCFRELAATVKMHGKKVAWVVFLNESFMLAATALFIFAVSTGYVTLVGALSSVQSFFVLLITVILSVFHPNILKEETGNSTVLLKLAVTIIMGVGAFLIT